MTSSSTPSHQPDTVGVPSRLQPRDVYDPYEAPDDIAPLFEAANTILHETPDPLWWNIPDVQVVELAFPDWDVVHVLDHPPTCRCRLDALAILRHRTNPDRWLILLGHGHRVCPGRGGTMGQFFRFRYHHMKNLAAVGTVDEVMAHLKQWRHHTSWAYTPLHVAQTIRDHCLATADASAPDMAAAQAAAVHVAAIDMLGGLAVSDDDLLTDTTPKQD